MSPKMAALLFWTCAASALSSVVGDTPVSKVLELLHNLLDEVKGEGTAEASSYDDFACFCRDTTDSKSSDIKSSRDIINTKSSFIAAKTATKEEKQDELQKRNKDHEKWSDELVQIENVFAKAKSDYEIKEADLSKAISSLENAIDSMENSKPSFLAVREKVQRGIALAGVLNLIPEPKRRALDTFLQTHTTVDPNDPVYKYHAQGIIDVLNKLLTDFRAEKDEVDTEFDKTKRTYNSQKAAYTAKISANSDAIAELVGTTIPNLKSEIAGARADLVEQESTLKDEQTYLQDLTEVCETRAKDWDQRSALRADEINQLSAAIHVLESEVVDMDNQTNKRALLIETPNSRQIVSPHVVGPSFLQESHASNNFASLSSKARQSQASLFLRKEGARLQSTALSSVAASLEKDPFDLVKTLIQRLIERLLRESTSEATKKGFCDEELGKARKHRKFRLTETQDLNLDIKGLELKEDELVAEIEMLRDAINKSRTELSTAQQEREIEHDQNMDTLEKAQSGLEGVDKAILILKVFYKNAAKATVLIQHSPVEDDTSGAGFSGAYKGKQVSSKAIIGLLAVIKEDFERTLRVTDASEKQAQADFVKLDRALRADISGNEEKKELDEEDLRTTRDSITSKMSKLQKAQDLLDNALKTLEDLKPACIDSGMSYADRVAKREDEIEALHEALCILAPDDNGQTEPDCRGGGQRMGR